MERVSSTDSTSETDREIKPIYRKTQKLSGNIMQLLSYILYILNFLVISSKGEIYISCEKINNGRQINKKLAVTLQHTFLTKFLNIWTKYLYIFKC